MKKTIGLTVALLLSFGIGVYVNAQITKQPKPGKKHAATNKKEKDKQMKLGAFSMSLGVKDLTISKEFYEKLGFRVFAGSMDQNYLIMKNGNALIGLFQGMFQGNILTFNPGWDENAQNLEQFDDIREIQRQLKSQEVPLSSEADEKTSGPASIMLTDPDGNVILLDQHR